MPGRGNSQTTTRGTKKAGGNLMETKIQSALAQGRGKEYKIFSSLHGAHMIHQSYHEARI
jgi:hypothetical protein